MILLIGAPCSGKSTIGQLLSEATNYMHITLDDFIQKSVIEKGRKEGDILTDKFIDNAVHDFFKNMNVNTINKGFIYELPYHDYSRLFKKEKVSKRLLIIGLYATYDTILERNNARKLKEQIPIEYIERCFNSIHTIREDGNYGIHFFDTEKKTATLILNEILTLISKND